LRYIVLRSNFCKTTLRDEEMKMNRSISEIVGTAEGANGARVTIYRALRQLLCARCGAAMTEGTLFTRRAVRGGDLHIFPQCRECAPFVLSTEKRSESALLRTLLSTPVEPPVEPSALRPSEVAEAVEKRLGPALRRVRRVR
jgi:RNase P subunit RPR2